MPAAGTGDRNIERYSNRYTVVEVVGRYSKLPAPDCCNLPGPILRSWPAQHRASMLSTAG